MRYLLHIMPEWAKNVCDTIAVPTGIAAALGVFNTVVGILAGLAAVGYTIYRAYDLYDQRRTRSAAARDSSE